MQQFAIVTQIDKFDSQFRENPLLAASKFEAKLMKLSADSGIPRMCIFLTIGYTEERENNPAIDRLVLNILYLAMMLLRQGRQK